MPTIGRTELRFVQGDITRAAVDAIVNAANGTLMGGGGVDGAIHRAGGPEILEDCKQRRQELGGPLPTGRAVITTGGRLPAKHVIHTVGPVWHGGERGEPALLASCHREALELARAHGLRTVAFPAISTGVYGYPVEEAAGVAVEAVRVYFGRHPDAFDEVRFVLFSADVLAAFEAAAAPG